MFFDTLDKLRKKPKATKRAIALGISISCTTIIGLVWVVSFGSYISEKNKDEMFGNAFGPLKELTGKISTGVEGISKTASGIFNKEAKGFKELSNELKSKNSTTTEYSVYDIDLESMPTSTLEEELIQ